MLRVLGKRKEKVLLEFSESEEVSHSHMSETIKDLLHEGLITVQDKYITLIGMKRKTL